METTARSRMSLVARVAALFLAAVFLAACSSEAPPPADDTAVPADAVVIEVSAVEFAFSMTDTPASAGTYTFELTNDGSMAHDLAIEGPSGGGGTDIVGPGDSNSVTLTLEPGEYTMYCSVGNHRAQGMEVTFTVT